MTVAQYEVADYFMGSTVGIERKTTGDFVQSIPRVLQQVEELHENFDYPYLLLEMKEFDDLFWVREMSDNSIIGALTSISAHRGVYIMPTNKEWLVRSIISIFKHHITPQTTQYIPIRPKANMQDKQQALLRSLPYIGSGKARELLSNYKSPAHAFKDIRNWGRGMTKKRREELGKIIYGDSYKES